MIVALGPRGGWFFRTSGYDRVMRRLAVAIATIVVLCASTGAAALSHTKASVYEPFGAGGAVIGHVKVASGYCFTGSEVANRDDAFRCFVGNLLYDPCLRSPVNRRVVVCPIPWDQSGTEIRLTKPLPAPSTHTPPSLALEPWALETTAGARCLLAGGASSVVGGVRLNYFCGAHASYGLWGYPSRRSRLWTIFDAPFSAHSLHHRVAIARAWM